MEKATATKLEFRIISNAKVCLLLVVLYCFGLVSSLVQVGGEFSSAASKARLEMAISQSIASIDTAQDQQQKMTTMRLPWRDTNFSPLTGEELRNLVIEAAIQEENDDNVLDVPGVAWMEHLNLIVGESRQVAENFYLDVLGFSADKGKSFHVNLGRQQFHLATPQASNDEIPHRIHGSVGLAVPNLETLWERLQKAKEDMDSNTNAYGFQGTLFDFYKEGSDIDESTIITVRCPWGNVFRCYSAKYRLQTKPMTSPQKMTNLHGVGGLHGADKMGVLGAGEPGIRYVEFVLPMGSSARKVASFYESTLQCPVFVKDVVRKESSGVDGSTSSCCLVSVGPGVHMVFVEPDASTKELDETAIFDKMKGIHVCLYAHNFRSLYQRLSDRSLIWTNPRFTRLDSCDTWEEAKRSRTLRFKHVVANNNDDNKHTTATHTSTKNTNHEVLLELEHETRPFRHGQFMKAPFYEPK